VDCLEQTGSTTISGEVVHSSESQFDRTPISGCTILSSIAGAGQAAVVPQPAKSNQSMIPVIQTSRWETRISDQYLEQRSVVAAFD